MSRRVRRGFVLVVAGLVLVSVAFGVSWAVAPDANRVSQAANPNNTSVLVGVQGPGPNGNVTALDGYGNVQWSIGNIISYQSVERLDNGSVLASFAAGDYQNCGPYESPCKRTGIRIIDPNPQPRVVYQWSYAVRTREDSEVHDAEMLPSGNVLVADMEYESIFVLNPKTRERVWTWNASQHYDAPADPTKHDWLHLNDVDRIGEGRYLVSIRNKNQLLIVERGKGVTEVINENSDPGVLDKQHNPHWLGEGAVLVADSENHRIVELHENESTGKWEVSWAVSKVGGLHFDWPRDADRLPNGHTFVTDSRNNRVVEITRNGSVVASYTVPSLPYEADRLPYGESASGNVAAYANPRSTASAPLGGQVPVLSTLLAGARHVVALPFWVSEIHVAAVGVAALLWLWGGFLLVQEGVQRASGGPGVAGER
ncbi:MULTISPECIES: aryl-sulfate sulfotransferase [Halorussus]|uniref:aryl-sulfate sulfotransferase n=1 Tax=Halorussus TaxID=1070314 RepID=UPI0020A16867|nr:aryl-sulfate sulfotransferase [Halorussus vallis]USZ76973.1 arylsulfotransferase family protein [Halorussus vallis]